MYFDWLYQFNFIIKITYSDEVILNSSEIAISIKIK
jgi:hypothetical protein